MTNPENYGIKQEDGVVKGPNPYDYRQGEKKETTPPPKSKISPRQRALLSGLPDPDAGFPGPTGLEGTG